MEAQEQVAIQIRRNEVEARVRKFKNGKTAGKDEVTEEMIKGGGDMVIDWIWNLCKMAFENGVFLEDWSDRVQI